MILHFIMCKMLELKVMIFGNFLPTLSKNTGMLNMPLRHALFDTRWKGDLEKQILTCTPCWQILKMNEWPLPYNILGIPL